MQLRATNEWANLKKVVVGTAQSMGGTPALEEAYDPKSKEHIAAGTFPTEADCVRELDALAHLLQGMDVEVVRPRGGAQFEPNLRPRRGHRGGRPPGGHPHDRGQGGRMARRRPVACRRARLPHPSPARGRARGRRRRDAPRRRALGGLQRGGRLRRHSPRRGPTKPPWIGCRTNSRIGTFGDFNCRSPTQTPRPTPFIWTAA